MTTMTNAPTNLPTKPDTTIKTVDVRQQQLKIWLQQVFIGQTFTLDSLPGDASARQYHRIKLTQSIDKPISGYIVMDSADEQDAMQQFVMVNKLMAPAVNVPEIIAQDVTQGFLVLQDFGQTEFAHLLVGATPVEVNSYYQLAMTTLIDLQQLSIESACNPYSLPHYDTEMLNREMDLFSEWFVPYIGVSLDKGIWSTLKAVLIENILAQPEVIVHRDYHSRNLMQDQADNKMLGVIDFQDAVIGAYSYDLVSLLRDAYVEWPESQVSDWIGDFWQLQQQAELTTTDSAEQFQNDVNVIGVQRHLKVLGIFVRLFERDGKSRYLADIPKVMRDLSFELEWLSKQGNDDIKRAILPFNKWLTHTALPLYQQKFSQ